MLLLCEFVGEFDGWFWMYCGVGSFCLVVMGGFVIFLFCMVLIVVCYWKKRDFFVYFIDVVCSIVI